MRIYSSGKVGTRDYIEPSKTHDREAVTCEVMTLRNMETLHKTVQAVIYPHIDSMLRCMKTLDSYASNWRYSGSVAAQRMRIDSSGRLLVGQTSADNTVNGSRLSGSGTSVVYSN